MDDSILMQFLFSAWRLIAFIIGLLVLAAIIAWNNGRMRRNKLEKRREEQDLELGTNTQKQSNRRTPSPSQFEDNLFAEPSDADFTDDLFAEVEPSVALDDNDPLAELFAARAEANDEQPIASEESPTIDLEEDDEDIIDLASLLTGMVEIEEEPKDYHTIADKPVSVKLTTKQMAVAEELLSIFRDDRDNRLMVQIGDVAYRTLVNDKVAKKTFASVMQELSGMVMNPDDNPPDSADVSDAEPNQMTQSLRDLQVSSGGETKAREMISILRDIADGHMIIQIGNTGYRTLVDNDKAKMGFSSIMKELSEAVTTPDDNPPIAPSAPIEKTPVTEPQRRDIFDDDQDDAVLPGDIRIAKMDDLPDAYKVGRFGQVKVKKVQKKVEDINIAEAIEAYLQHKISQTPKFQKRGIHIWSAFGGGVRIEADGKNYEFVDEVEDLEVRAFIQKAINEWQERH